MANLTLLQSVVGFVLLLAGIYAFLWGLWFLGVRFVPAWPFITLLRQTQRERSQDRDNPASLLNEYLKRRGNAQASGRECPECSAEARAQSRLRRKQR